MYRVDISPVCTCTTLNRIRTDISVHCHISIQLFNLSLYTFDNFLFYVVVENGTPFITLAN